MTKIKKYNIEKYFFAVALVLSLISQGAPAFATEQRMLVPMGKTVGIQMHTDGVLVVGLSATREGQELSPAAIAGVIPGDLIVAVNGNKISSAEDFKAQMQKLTGDPVELMILRNGESIKMNLKPSMGSMGPELGLWLRDKITGIGTLTFYDPSTGLYGGLGHGINDFESGVIMPLGGGDIYPSRIVEVKKGCAGLPGELCGDFKGKDACGNIMKNTHFGIFGKLSGEIPDVSNALPLAESSEIVLGKATVLAGVEGTSVQEFEVEITRVYHGESDGRSLMLSIRDKTLLEKTGGIVQGMSGSPILQNGKLIGAVTHVMINDPTKGFGISVEKMLEQTQGLKADRAA